MTFPLRIAQIIGSTGLYGAERWILALTRAMDSRQIESTIVNLIDAPGEPSAIVQAAISRNLKAIDFLTGGSFNPYGVFRFSEWVRRNNIDILHAHGYKSDIFSLVASKIIKNKVISTPHGWSKEDRDWKLKLYESIDRWCLRYMDCVCPLSPGLWEDIKKSGLDEKRNIFIRNCVDLEEIDNIPAVEGKEDGVVIIGYVGRIVEGKNLLDLFKAFRLVMERKANSRLLIVGEGPKEPELRKAAEDMKIIKSVSFTGYRADATTLMKSIDIFILPSRSEGIPRCVMEAMALGIPVIGSDIPGNRELVEHGMTGLLYPLNESEKLAKAIFYIMDHPDEALKMRRRARSRIEKQFSATRMAKDYIGLYQDISTLRNSI